jgi:hypothetical protein
MGSISFNINFNKNEGLLISPSELLDTYLPGIPLCYPSGGQISSDSIKQKIKAAQIQLENFLSIKFQKQQIEERQDFTKSEYLRWGYIKTVYPIMKPLGLKGMINDIQQVQYPDSWLSTKRGTDNVSFRNLFLIPNTGSSVGATAETSNSFVYNGMTFNLSFFASDYIPNYWKINYCTGWDDGKVPMDLLDTVAKIASIQVLAMSGDIIFGAGIGNQSISIDGISQSYSTTKGGGKGAFSGRIEQYKAEVVEALARLKAEYVGITFRML